MRFVSLLLSFSIYNPKKQGVQAETNGTYLYIHSKKEAKLPLVHITLANGEKHKLYFISHANQVPNKIASLIESRLSD